jgi:hypothetical protein
MELFLPGVIILILAAFFAFLVVPRVGSAILAIFSLFAIVAVGVHHYSLFHSEYQLSTWQYGLASYAPWITLAFAILFIIASIFFIVGEKTKNIVEEAIVAPVETLTNAVEEAINSLPPAETATNAVTSAINTSIRTIKSVLPNMGPGNNMSTEPAYRPNGRATGNGNRGVGERSLPVPGYSFRPSEI